ncbi:MAG TPA: hypothetical protein VFY03_06185, partial [Woeseiaceae bacterium]|nr:hypothetical protein [Woeseiaceae bacterium]
MDAGRFAFATSWGANYRDGTTRFRLWAPGAKRVELVLSTATDEANEDRPLHRDSAGWWHCNVTDVEPGARYGFRVDGGPAVP